ncbi:Non-specific serine/threonine protein kinase [Forsythia ovata]|uniref:RING-type E3 ubiquitin transferase n=1 Tax=Forsythia ovata TaxID=205694 RepID=A0ABD1WPJ2_9LAMI
MVGFCSELNCIIFEYMHNGCLHDALLLTERNSKGKNKAVSWHARIRIAAEECSALGFLHKTQPMPLIHGNLNPSNIILDRNNVAKVYGLKPPWLYDNSNRKSDIQAFGNLVLQLLIGRNWGPPMDIAPIIGDLDHLEQENVVRKRKRESQPFKDEKYMRVRSKESETPPWLKSPVTYARERENAVNLPPCKAIKVRPAKIRKKPLFLQKGQR